MAAVRNDSLIRKLNDNKTSLLTPQSQQFHVLEDTLAAWLSG